MKKIQIFMLLIIAATSLTACSGRPEKGPKSKIYYDMFWEREKLTSNLYVTGPRAKNLLDVDLAECITIVKNRQNIEENSLNTKKCVEKNGLDWEMESNYTFLKQCMQRRGWIPSNCCAFTKDCSCK